MTLKYRNHRYWPTCIYPGAVPDCVLLDPLAGLAHYQMTTDAGGKFADTSGTYGAPPFRDLNALTETIQIGVW